MKKLLGMLLLVTLVSACERRAAAIPTPTSTVEPIPLPTGTATLPPTSEPVITVLPPTETQEGLTATITASPTVQATQTESPTIIPTPTSTPGPTTTPSGPRLDPEGLWGPPTFKDPMGSFSKINWEGEDGALPDTVNIRLELKEDQLHVTGKRLGFSTWWFSWPFLGDAYVEMLARTDACSGKDAYGLILRGPTRGAPKTHGYIAAFSCDGSYLLRRVDSTDPYTAVDLIGWTQTNALKAGPNQENLVGVQMDGSTLALYANRFKVAEFSDPSYSEGRYGVFVSPALTQNLTYRVEEITYWEITE